MDLGKKIRIAREERGLSQSDLAEKLKITSRTLQNYEYGTTIPGTEIINKIAKILNFRINFFFNEESDVSSVVSHDVSIGKSVVSHDVSQKKPQKLQNLRTLVDEQENRLINLRFFPSVSAAAGYGANNDDESFEIISVTASFLIKILGVKAQEYDIIKVLGDSMEPFIKNGDMAIILPTHEASNGEIIIANLGGDLYAKKLLRDPIKKHVRLTSMNDFYDDITIKGNELDQLKIVGIVKKVVPSGVLAL